MSTTKNLFSNPIWAQPSFIMRSYRSKRSKFNLLGPNRPLRSKTGQERSNMNKNPYCESRTKIIMIAESRSLGSDRCSSIFSLNQDLWVMMARWRSLGHDCLIINVWLRSLHHNGWITIPESRSFSQLYIKRLLKVLKDKLLKDLEKSSR